MRGNRVLGALCCLTILLSAPASARDGAEASGHLFSDRLSFGRDGKDLLAMVQYSDAMQHCASVLKAGRKSSCRFMPEVNEVRFSFWVWRDETGTTINRTLEGTYRLRPPGCLGGFCVTMECRIPSAPTMICDDGTEHVWSAPDRVHFEIDGVLFERIRKE